MADTPKVDRGRLIKLAEWLGAQKARMDLGLPSEWNQQDWLVWRNGELLETTGCGTACCIAGKVALEDGGIPVRSDFAWIKGEGRYADIAISVWDRPEAGESASMVVFGKDASLDTAVQVDAYAQSTLGLTSYQADLLFEQDNDYEQAIQVIRDILGGDL